MDVIEGVNDMDSMQIRDDLSISYSNVYSPQVIATLNVMAHFNVDQKQLMAKRMHRRARRIEGRARITFLEPDSTVSGSDVVVAHAREGRFSADSSLVRIFSHFSLPFVLRQARIL